ncbi:homoserine kinase [Lentilactobacillus sunkii]|jgi:diphosphomevalonate decarboxylase|uniref:diphosphomevalonate decarboxylase n=1 Tax=Lentilactobacillus sunkii TaxID=481719 RepID=A0A1E7XAE1_9LACO|nr:diphosphomevalonate decarboxylase [Lentilactobacillus sunkii]OFA10095.1 homoserine kinase [Lentilactobacillus sunkii]
MTTSSDNVVTAVAHTNIALIKYWGKRDANLIIPYTGSLSLTLDQFYTETSVNFDQNLDRDEVSIDDQSAANNSWQRVHDFLEIVREKSGTHLNAKVVSHNHVPTAAGLASSASAFAALAAAASKAAGMNLNNQELSILARRGSGSACRSIFGGFVEWQRGTDDADSYAVPINTPHLNDIRVVALTIEKHQKPISSRRGMALSVTTSPYYPTWVKVVESDLQSIKSAINQDDFTRFGTISELNAMRMHALTLSSDPDFLYFNGRTLDAMNEVKRLRHSGVECYYTIDAGPNVKVICQTKNVKEITTTFSKLFGPDKVTVAQPGPGIKYL